MREAIKRAGGFSLLEDNTHHAWRKHMDLLERYSEPVVTVIRSPHAIIRSRFASFLGKPPTPLDFADWFKTFVPDLRRMGCVEPPLFAYEPWVDRNYAFERGLDVIMDELGLEGVVPWVGKNPYDVPEMPAGWRDLVSARFPDDCALWRRVMVGN